VFVLRGSLFARTAPPAARWQALNKDRVAGVLFLKRGGPVVKTAASAPPTLGWVVRVCVAPAQSPHHPCPSFPTPPLPALTQASLISIKALDSLPSLHGREESRTQKEAHF
jgi:hypothetical protein